MFEVVEATGGLYIGARRNAEDDQYYWRITPWVMPCFTMVPPRGDHPVHGHFWVPIDDENCWAWSFDYHPDARSDRRRSAGDEGRQGHSRALRAWHVPIPLQNKDNDYLMDRAAQKAGTTYSGVEGIAMQDASLQESMGPISDRTQREPRLDRQRHHHGASSPDEGRGARGERHRAAGHRPRAPTVPFGRHRAAADKPFKEGAREDLTVRPGIRQTSI